MRSDSALAERFSAGDETAFDVIYERHRSVVLAVSMGVLGTTQDAEDATQETFSALALALRSKPPAELRPWLIRVARNASIDTTRRRRHRLLTLDGEIPEIPARQAAAGQAELAVVLDGIRELPEGQRMALLMRELGGHTYTEIAEFLETDEEAVKGLIARARVGLRTYREATELPCATARTAIAAEPDGRRYDKTIRRHLRTCASCRSYRAALRDDAKVLRAALPLQTGSVATGGISTGMLTAAKGTLIGYGLTQAATTCAASACAVGAIGGMVFVTPVHRLGLPPIWPAAKSAPAPKHLVSKPVSKSTVVTVSSVHAAGTAVPATASATTGRSVVHHHAKNSSAVRDADRKSTAGRHQHHKLTTTRVKLPTHLPGATTNAPAAASTPAAGAVNPTSALVPAGTVTSPSQTPTNPVSSTVTDPTSTTSTYGNQPASQNTQGTGSTGYGASWASSGSPTTTSTSTITTSTSTATTSTPTTSTTPGSQTQTTGTGTFGISPPSGIVHTGGGDYGAGADRADSGAGADSATTLVTSVPPTTPTTPTPTITTLTPASAMTWPTHGSGRGNHGGTQTSESSSVVATDTSTDSTTPDSTTADSTVTGTTTPGTTTTSQTAGWSAHHDNWSR